MEVQRTQQRFNLVSDSWIPVVYLNATYRGGELSLLELFKHCHEIREIAGDIPQQSFAIIRLLEAIMYRAYSKYCDPYTDEYAYKRESTMEELWCRLWRQGLFDKGVDKCLYRYLDTFKGGFNLFGSTPFYQIRDLTYTKREPDSADKLVVDIPKKERFLFSLRDRDAATELTCSEAARWLIFRQAYDTAGIKTSVKGGDSKGKGKCKIRGAQTFAPKDVVKTCWCGAIGGIYLEGSNLFETLMLNWVLFSGESMPLLGSKNDLPPWEHFADPNDPVYTVTSSVHKSPTGPVSLLTWQSRRIRLVGDALGKNISDVVICYGDTLDEHDRQNVEMWTSWRENEDKRKKLKTVHIPWTSRRHDPAKALWRGFSSLLAKGEVREGMGDLRPGVVRWVELLEDRTSVFDVSATIKIRAQGMGYGEHGAMFVDSVDDSFDFCPAILRCDDKAKKEQDSFAVQEIENVIFDTDKAVNCLVVFIMDVEYATGYVDQNSDEKKNSVYTAKNNVREQAYSVLDELFRRKIKSFPSDEDIAPYVDEWRDEVRKKLLSIAEDYLASSKRSAFSEHDEKSVGGAWSKFTAIITWILLG